MAGRLVPLRPVLAALRRPARRTLFPAPHAALATQYWLPSYLDLFAMGMGLALLERVGRAARATSAGRRRASVGIPRGAGSRRGCHATGSCASRVGLPRDLTPLTGKQAMVRQLLYGLTALFLLLPAVFGPQDRGLVRKFLVLRADGVPRARVVRHLPLARGVDRAGVLVVRLHGCSTRRSSPSIVVGFALTVLTATAQLLPRRAAGAAVQGPPAVARRRASRPRRRRREPGRTRRRDPTPRSRHGWRPSRRTRPTAACPSSPTGRTSRAPTACAPSRR